MRALYGKDVFPDALMALWNNGLEHMEHVLADTVAVADTVALGPAETVAFNPDDESVNAHATFLV